MNRLLRIVIIESLLLLATPLAAGVTNPSLSNCLQRQIGHEHSPINLQADCPQLFAELTSKNLLDAIEPPISDKLSVTQLQALNSLLQQKKVNRSLDYQGLNSLLNELRILDKKDEASEWWDQFLNWLKSLKPEQYEAEFDWLVEIFNALMPSEQALQLFTKVMIYFLVIISLGIIIWEFYLGGVFSRFGARRRTKLTINPESTPAIASGLTFAEISQLAPVKQVAALLSCTITKLIEQQQLPEDASMTNRQLMAHLQRQDVPTKSAFIQLVQQAEPVLYGGVQPSPIILQQCWQNAELICAD